MTAQIKPAHLQLKKITIRSYNFIYRCAQLFYRNKMRDLGTGPLVQLTIQCEIAVHSTIRFIGVLNTKLNPKNLWFLQNSMTASLDKIWQYRLPQSQLWYHLKYQTGDCMRTNTCRTSQENKNTVFHGGFCVTLL